MERPRTVGPSAREVTKEHRVTNEHLRGWKDLSGAQSGESAAARVCFNNCAQSFALSVHGRSSNKRCQKLECMVVTARGCAGFSVCGRVREH